MPVITRAWIEHHATRVVSLAGFVGGLFAMVNAEFPIISVAVAPEIGVAVTIASAALHLGNRALDAFAQSSGVLHRTPMSNLSEASSLDEVA